MAVNMIEVDAVRLSLILAATQPGLLAGAPAKHGGDVMSTRDGYLRAFKRARARSGLPTLPWSATFNRFWWYYLKRRDLDKVAGQLAWERLVPLRTTTIRLMCSEAPDVRAGVETFRHPHGVAAIATVSIQQATPLADMVDRLVDAMNSWTYVARGSTSDEGHKLIWATARCLEEAATVSADADAARIELQGEPFTVTTVIHGSGVQLGKKVHGGDLVHKALNGCCTFRRNWRKDTPSPLAPAEMGRQERTPGNVLYALAHKRALWFPDLFTIPCGPATHSLGCFHRNLALASMQTQSLLGLAQWGAWQVGHRTQLRFDVDEMMRNCARLLGLLYGRVEDMYRSISIHRQIADSDLLGSINTLRSYYGDGWETLR